MTDEPWNDQARLDLQDRIRSTIRGELRMIRFSHEELLDHCSDLHLQDQCPEAECPEMLAFAATEIESVAAQLTAEISSWPVKTDSDRLDIVEQALRDRGILLWQASPCCDSCTGSELPDRIEVIAARYPGFQDRLRGYTFFIDQNLPHMLSQSSKVSVYLAYGWFTLAGTEVSPKEYEAEALNIAREVCESLRSNGFKMSWNEQLSSKISLTLNWQRRTALT